MKLCIIDKINPFFAHLFSLFTTKQSFLNSRVCVFWPEETKAKLWNMNYQGTERRKQEKVISCSAKRRMQPATWYVSGEEAESEGREEKERPTPPPSPPAEIWSQTGSGSGSRCYTCFTVPLWRTPLPQLLHAPPSLWILQQQRGNAVFLPAQAPTGVLTEQVWPASAAEAEWKTKDLPSHSSF